MRNFTPFSTALCLIAFVVVFTGAIAFFSAAHGSGASTTSIPFVIEKGDGVREVAHALHDAGLVRYESLFELSAFVTGRAHLLKPGNYLLNHTLNTFQILSLLVKGPSNEAEVTIPEGSTLIDVDEMLAKAHVLPAGALLKLSKKVSLEGYLFPDTYRFYLNSTTTDVVKKMTDTFDGKARSLLLAATKGDQSRFQRLLTLSSLLEREVPDGEDRKIVAGIILKRLEAHIPLQIDATICYIKQKHSQSCEPISILDLKNDSPYNTYLHTGLPPAPINNPGLDAIKASISPLESPYWYYLSDPKTNKTIFSKTLEEHRENRARYLAH